MFTFNTNDSLYAIAGTTGSITYTIMGMTISSSNQQNYGIFSQGTIQSSVNLIYVSPSPSLVKTISLVNTTSATVSNIVFYVNGTSSSNQIKTLSISGTGSAIFNGKGWELYDQYGVIQTSGPGVQGPQGITGNSGTSGTSGLSGTSGTSGTSGLSGSSGSSGTSGTSGSSGSSGSSGTSGSSGSSGSSGTSGSSGSSGSSGTSGSSGITRQIFTSQSGLIFAGSTPSTDYVYLFTGFGTVSMPTAINNYNLYTIKNTYNSYIYVVFTSSQTADGSPTISISSYQSLDFISNLTNGYNIV